MKKTLFAIGALAVFITVISVNFTATQMNDSSLAIRNIKSYAFAGTDCSTACLGDACADVNYNTRGTKKSDPDCWVCCGEDTFRGAKK